MWYSAWKTFHVHSAQKRACSPHQEPHAQTVGAKASSSVQSLPSLAIPCGQSQPSSLGRGAKGAIPVCAGSVSTLEWRVGVHSMAEGWAGGCHWHGLCSPCVSGAAVQDWYILLILEGWYHCLGVDLRSYWYINCRDLPLGVLKSQADSQPAAQPRCRSLLPRSTAPAWPAATPRSAGSNCRQQEEKNAAGKMLLLWAQNLLLSQWGVSNMKEKNRVSGLSTYLLWSLEALVQLLMNILHL